MSESKKDNEANKNIYGKLNDVLTIVCIVVAAICFIAFLIMKKWRWLFGSVTGLFVFYFVMSLYIDLCSNLSEIACNLKEINEREKTKGTMKKNYEIFRRGTYFMPEVLKSHQTSGSMVSSPASFGKNIAFRRSISYNIL